jgi:archaemetzincin
MEGPKSLVNSTVLAHFTEAFYLGCKVVLLPPIDLIEEVDSKGHKVVFWHGKGEEFRYEMTARFDEKTGRRQLHVDPILHLLSDMRNSKSFKEKHKDAFCIMAFTMEDLFSCKTDLFVAGMAAGGSKVAVFSFARYQPGFRFSREFWFKWYPLKVPSDPTVILRRSIKLLVHELAHLFGFGHCVFFDCCMNGSGHLEEDFRQSMFLCPVDLKKLKARLGAPCDLGRRYELLSALYRQHGLEAESDWIDRRCQSVLGEVAKPKQEAVGGGVTTAITSPPARKKRKK